MQKNVTPLAGPNIYRLTWQGHPQPLGSNTLHSVKMYIESSVRQGCKLSDFKIFDKWGELKLSVINDREPDAKERTTTDYKKIFNS